MKNHCGHRWARNQGYEAPLRPQVGVPEPGKYRIALDSDDAKYGGPARVGHGEEHFTHPEGQPGTGAWVMSRDEPGLVACTAPQMCQPLSVCMFEPAVAQGETCQVVLCECGVQGKIRFVDG